MIKTLSATDGISGAEDKVREYIKDTLCHTEFDISTDGMGNLFVRSEMTENAPNVILSAHMDEAGLIITAVTDDGYLKFDTIGEIPAASLLSKRVSVEGIPGVISAKAVHLMSKEERSNPVKVDNLYIDIGAESATEAMSMVTPGDYCSFDDDFSLLGQNCISGKALSGRCGCASLINILKVIDTERINVTAIFTTQKNIASRGMKTALYSIKTADTAIVLDSFEASEREFWKCDIKILFPSPTTDPKCREYAEKLVSAAESGGIKCKTEFGQSKTDADAIIKERPYIPTLVVSVPCLNKNTPSEIIKKGSIGAASDIVLKFTEMIKNGI